MHFMAGGTEFTVVLPHKRLQECLAVWLRIDVCQKSVQRSYVSVPAGSQFMERGIFDCESAVPHGTIHVCDCMTGDAAQPILRFRRIYLLRNRLLKPTIEEDCMDMAPGAPLT